MNLPGRVIARSACLVASFSSWMTGLFGTARSATWAWPWPAILADTGAAVLVTLNALRLLRWRPATAGAIT